MWIVAASVIRTANKAGKNKFNSHSVLGAWFATRSTRTHTHTHTPKLNSQRWGGTCLQELKTGFDSLQFLFSFSSSLMMMGWPYPIYHVLTMAHTVTWAISCLSSGMHPQVRWMVAIHTLILRFSCQVRGWDGQTQSIQMNQMNVQLFAQGNSRPSGVVGEGVDVVGLLIGDLSLTDFYFHSYQIHGSTGVTFLVMLALPVESRWWRVAAPKAMRVRPLPLGLRVFLCG